MAQTGYTDAELQGTYLAMFDVQLPEDVLKRVESVVTKEYYNPYSDVFKGETFEKKGHITVHMKLPSLPSSSSEQDQRHRAHPRGVGCRQVLGATRRGV